MVQLQNTEQKAVCISKVRKVIYENGLQKLHLDGCEGRRISEAVCRRNSV